MSAPLEKAEHVIKAYQDYVKFLGEAERDSIGMLQAHGWSFPPHILAKGAEHREIIKKAMEAYTK